MYTPRLHDFSAQSIRLRYAVTTVLRDRVVNDGKLKNFFEMEDAAEVTTAVLKRGPKKAPLRAILESSQLVNLTSWLTLHAELPEAYYRLDQGSSVQRAETTGRASLRLAEQVYGRRSIGSARRRCARV
jgi:hypothetical protein